jgi:hypothetical protein
MLLVKSQAENLPDTVTTTNDLEQPIVLYKIKTKSDFQSGPQSSLLPAVSGGSHPTPSDARIQNMMMGKTRKRL